MQNCFFFHLNHYKVSVKLTKEYFKIRKSNFFKFAKLIKKIELSSVEKIKCVKNKFFECSLKVWHALGEGCNVL